MYRGRQWWSAPKLTYVDSDDLSNIMQIKSSFNQVKCNVVWNKHILFSVSIVEDIPEVLLHVPEALHIVAVVHRPHLPCTAQITRQNVPAERKETRFVIKYWRKFKMYLKWFLRVVRSPEWKVTLLATFSLRNGLTMDMSMLNSLTKQIYQLRSHFPIMTPRSVDNVTLPHPKWKWDVEERSKIPSILVANGSHLKYLIIIWQTYLETN